MPGRLEYAMLFCFKARMLFHVMDFCEWHACTNHRHLNHDIIPHFSDDSNDVTFGLMLLAAACWIGLRVGGKAGFGGSS